jgi:hypothetical protein
VIEQLTRLPLRPQPHQGTSSRSLSMGEDATAAVILAAV